MKLDVTALLLTGMRWRSDEPGEAALAVLEVMELLFEVTRPVPEVGAATDCVLRASSN